MDPVRGIRVTVTALLLLGASCQPAAVNDRPLSHHAASGEGPAADPVEELSARVAFNLARAEQRLHPELEVPRTLGDRPCPDAQLRAEAKPPLLHLMARDSRADRRNLLPLSVMGELARDELAAVRARFKQPADALAAPTFRVLRSRADGESAARALDALERRPYAAVAHVIGYAEPRLIQKVGERHRRWVAGTLDTLVVAYDLSTGDALCQARVTVHNDTREAPVSARLRSDTRERLTRALAHEYQREAPAALARITRVLVWPQTATSDGRPRP